jgi:DNA (cytosine-5)-methyltransferase 1
MIPPQPGEAAHSGNDQRPTPGGAVGFCQPLLVPYRGERNGQEPRAHSIHDPVPTVTTLNGHALIEPYIVPLNHGGEDSRAYPVHRPMPTLTSLDAWALVEPCLVKYYGTADARPIGEPLDTVTSRDRFGLVIPEKKGYKLDIRFRMLQPHELAGAMSFPHGYHFAGSRELKVKQIGNAVAVRLAQALFREILSDQLGPRTRPAV